MESPRGTSCGFSYRQWELEHLAAFAWLDTYADDLAQLVEKLDLRDAIHVGHSTGGGEVVRYIARPAQSVSQRRF